ncbi:hypothetical protein OAX78_04395 [Planctomycetota bacterium]|nr:hypothetical protein [Planctomycetota bacterium]
MFLTPDGSERRELHAANDGDRQLIGFLLRNHQPRVRVRGQAQANQFQVEEVLSHEVVELEGLAFSARRDVRIRPGQTLDFMFTLFQATDGTEYNLNLNREAMRLVEGKRVVIRALVSRTPHVGTDPKPLQFLGVRGHTTRATAKRAYANSSLRGVRGRISADQVVWLTGLGEHAGYQRVQLPTLSAFVARGAVQIDEVDAPAPESVGLIRVLGADRGEN